MMPDILIRSVPAPLHEALKKRAREENRSVSDVAKDVIRQGLDRTGRQQPGSPNAWDAIRIAIGDDRMTAEEAGEFDRAMAERRQQSPRALPDFE